MRSISTTIVPSGFLPINFELHQPCVRAIGVALLEHGRLGVDRIAVKNRVGMLAVVHLDFGNRVLARVLRREPDRKRQHDAAVHEQLAADIRTGILVDQILVEV